MTGFIVRWTTGGAKSTMKMAAEQHCEAGRQQRAPDQRPGVKCVRRRRRVRARVHHRPDLAIEVAPRAQPGQAVVAECRPRAPDDEHDHQDDPDREQTCHRAEQLLGAVVAPRST
jgi:hypothetical protein